MQSIDIKVLGGLPITVAFTLGGDSGNPYIDSWKITHIADNVCKKKPEWLYNRINKANENDLIESQIEEAVTN